MKENSHLFLIIFSKGFNDKNICFVNYGNSASSPASEMPKTPAKPSYSLVGDLHGMQGVSGSSPLGSIEFFLLYQAFLEIVS